MTVIARFGTGGGNTPLILEKTYQEKTGTLSPGAHAGSYNGQDAYNDMLVVENEMELLERRADSGNVVGSECGGGSTNAG